MRIILNENPLWTERHLYYIQSHSESFGNLFSVEQINQELINIQTGNATQRCDDFMACYELFNENNDYIGDITITELSEHGHELDILIFDEFQGQGLATQAIQLFINEYFQHPIGNRFEAVIRCENPYKEAIERIITKSNFQFIYEDHKGNKVFEYRVGG